VSSRPSGIFFAAERRINAKRFAWKRRSRQASLRVDPSSPACAWLCRDDKREFERLESLFRDSVVPSPTFSCGRGFRCASSITSDVDCPAFQSHLNRENMLSARTLETSAARVTVVIWLAWSYRTGHLGLSSWGVGTHRNDLRNWAANGTSITGKSYAHQFSRNIVVPISQSLMRALHSDIAEGL
jgi:hypothetical protein